MSSANIHQISPSPVSFPFFARRVHAALQSLGIPAPSLDKLEEFVPEEFDHADLQYAHHLLSGRDFAWHTVSFGPEWRSLRKHEDTFWVTTSLVTALSLALSELDETRHAPSGVALKGSAIEIYRGSDTLVRIEPVALQAPDPVARRRVENDLKGLKRYGGDLIACARLSTLPGLAQLKALWAGSDRSDRAPWGPVFSKTALSLAKGLRTGLATSFGLALTQSQAQHVFATGVGAANWAHLIAHQSDSACRTPPSRVAIAGNGAEPVYRFYRTTAEGIWGFAQAVRQYPEGMLAEPIFGGSSGSFHGAIYMFAGLASTPLDSYGMRPDEVWLDMPDVSDGHEDYMPLAIRLEQHPDGIIEALLAHFDVSSPIKARIAAGSQRLGIAPGDSATIGKWHMTFRRHGECWYLHAERFAGTGRRLASYSTTAYKAEIQYDDAKSLCVVVGEYGASADLLLTDFTAQDVALLSLFCNGRLNPSIKPALHGYFSTGEKSSRKPLHIIGLDSVAPD